MGGARWWEVMGGEVCRSRRRSVERGGQLKVGCMHDYCRKHSSLFPLSATLEACGGTTW